MPSLGFVISAFRCPTPKRCCSSIMLRARRGSLTFGSRTACVATRTIGSPAASISSTGRRCFSGTLPLRNSTRKPSGSRRFRRTTSCCRARSSVGARKTPCKPQVSTAKSPTAATTVFPQPTSPWMRRTIPDDWRSDFRTSSMTSTWPLVRSKGSAFTKASNVGRSMFTTGADLSARSIRRDWRTPCRMSSSS